MPHCAVVVCVNHAVLTLGPLMYFVHCSLPDLPRAIEYLRENEGVKTQVREKLFIVPWVQTSLLYGVSVPALGQCPFLAHTGPSPVVVPRVPLCGRWRLGKAPVGPQCSSGSDCGESCHVYCLSGGSSRGCPSGGSSRGQGAGVFRRGASAHTSHGAAPRPCHILCGERVAGWTLTCKNRIRAAAAAGKGDIPPC